MSFDSDTSKEVFCSTWPGGYVENFDKYPKDSELQVVRILARFADPIAHCLEIGPGRGFWTTKYLCKLFHDVICIDVIPKPKREWPSNVFYFQVGDREFNCPGVIFESIDFVFSFGVFCHLTESAIRVYLASLFRVMKPNARALICFANWQRHPSTPKDESAKRFANERHADGTCWFYCDSDLARCMVEDAGFVNFEDTLPEFRDTLAAFRKP